MANEFVEAGKLIPSLVDASTGADTAMRKVIRRKRIRVVFNVTNGAARFQIGKVEEACSVLACKFVPTSTVAANANSLSCALRKHDGAGGAATALSTTFDGTALGVTAQQETSLAGLDETDTAAVGNWLELNVTVNGTGAAWGVTTFDIELQLNG